MKRTISILLCFAVLLLTLSGCAPELHERLLISAVGIDSTDSGWRVTVRVSKTDESRKEESFTGDGETISEALEQISKRTGKKPLYSHNSLILFGRACAEQGLQNCLDFFLRHYDSRPTVKVFIAEDTAEEILTVKDASMPVMQSNEIASLMKAEEYSGTTPDSDLITLLNGTYGPNKGALVPLLRAGESPELAGAVLLQDLKLFGELDDEALRGWLLLSGKLTSGETVFEHPDCGKVSIAAGDSSCSIRFTGSNEAPRFAVNVQIEGEISMLSHGITQLESSVFPGLEFAYAEAIMQNVEDYLYASVYGSGCDAAGFGRAVLQADPNIWYSVSEEFSLFLQKAEFDVHVQAQIDRVEEQDSPYL